MAREISDLAMTIYNNIMEANKPQVTTAQSIFSGKIEAWKKMPKEQALEEALSLLYSSDMEVAEKRARLEILKFAAELQGALQPTIPQSMHVVAIEVITPGQRTEHKIINVTSK